MEKNGTKEEIRLLLMQVRTADIVSSCQLTISD